MSSSTPLRILHVSTTVAGGLGQSILTLLKHLDKRRFAPAIAFGPGYPLDDAFKKEGIPTFPISMARRHNPAANALGFLQLCRLMHAQRFDIVHVHGSIAGVLARLAARVTKVPVVICQLHGYANRDPHSVLERTLYLWIEQWLDRYTDYYVAVSDAVRRAWLRRGVMTDARVEVIHHGIDLDVPLAPMPALPLARQRVLGTMSLMEERKGLTYLLDAMPSVLSSRADVVLWMIGDGPLRPSLEKQAAKLGLGNSVRWFGWRTDAFDLLRQLDLFVLPSIRESFGMVLLEAMALERPVVATEVDGIPEVVENGVSGLLVPAGDSQALSTAILQLLNAPALAARMGKAGHARVHESFDARSVAKLYEALYERQVQQRPLIRAAV